MEEFVRELGEDFVLDNCIIKSDEVIFKIFSKKPEMQCPYCGIVADQPERYTRLMSEKSKTYRCKIKRLYCWFKQENFCV